MNKIERVEQYLRDYGSVTSLEIFQLVYSMCPHTIIRDLREKYGYAAIEDEWQENTHIYFDEKGKMKRKKIRYKRYFWRGIA